MVQVKGYLYTALTILMFMSIFMLAWYFQVRTSAMSRTDIDAEKTAALFDAAGYNLGKVAGTGARISNGDTFTVSFDDHMPAANNVTSGAAGFGAFLAGDFARDANARISPDLSALSSQGQVDFMVEPYGYSWGWQTQDKRVVWLRNATNEHRPQTINVSLDFSAERAEDLIWMQAENFTGDAAVIAEDTDASGGEFVESFSLLTNTIDVPIAANYTLWVRSAVDNASKNFTVEVDGVNSTWFNLRDWSLEAADFRWNNDSLIVYNLSAGVKTIRIYPELSSGTESIDVIMLTTRGVELPITPPIISPPDPFAWKVRHGGGMHAGLRIRLANGDYDFFDADMSRDSRSDWNITFADNDSIRIQFGAPSMNGLTSASSMRVELNDTVNRSRGAVNATATFEGLHGRAYVDADASMAVTGRLSRQDRLYLARG